MILVPRLLPWEEQPWGAPAPTSLLGAPVFTFDGARGPIELNRHNAGTLTGTGAALGAGRAGQGFDNSATAGNRLSFAHQTYYEVSETAPMCILVSLDITGFHDATGGFRNDLIAQCDTNASTGVWRLSTSSDGIVAWDYRRTSGAIDVAMTWAAGSCPTSGPVTLLLVHEKQSNPNPWRLWVNGVDRGYAADPTFNGSELQAGGTNAISIGGSAGNTTRGVKGVYALAHIAKRVLPSDMLARDVSTNPWLIFDPQRIWVPVSAAAGGSVSLTVADAAHGHVSDAVVLTTADALAVADAAHAHTSDALTLSASGATALAVADAAHLHTVDGLVLSSDALLTIQAALHAHASDLVTLSTSGAPALLISDQLHAHTADGVALTVSAWLVVANAMHAHSSANVVLAESGADVALDAPLFDRVAAAAAGRLGSPIVVIGNRRIGGSGIGGPAAH